MKHSVTQPPTEAKENVAMKHSVTRPPTEGLNMKEAWVHVASLVIFSAKTQAQTKQEDETCTLASAHKPKNKGR